MKGRRRGALQMQLHPLSQFGSRLRRLANTNSRSCARDKEHQYPFKAQVVPEHTMQVYSGSRGIAPLILNPSTKWSSFVTRKHNFHISIVKPTRCTIFEFIEYHSTCFGRSFRPSSGVRDCTYSIRYMSYRLVDCLLAG